MSEDVVQRERVRTAVGEKSRTKQSFAEESDINAIMRKYLSSGILPHLSSSPPRYGDFSTAGDYLEAMNKVKDAEQRFADLPSNVRDHVDNDPAKLLELAYDESRRDELVELGLLPPEPVVPEAVQDPLVDDPAPAEPVPVPAEPVSS